jgi:hypothetical protein
MWMQTMFCLQNCFEEVDSLVTIVLEKLVNKNLMCLAF